MKPLYIIMVLALLVSSCKTSRHAQKSMEKSDQTVTTSNQLNVQAENKTKTTITEKTQDTIEIAPVKVQAIGAGKTVTTVVNGDTLKSTYDPVKDIMTAQFASGSKKIPVNKEKLTEVIEDSKVAVRAKSDSTGKTSTVSKDKDVMVKKTFAWWWILVGAGVVIGLWYLNKRYNFINKLRKRV